MIGLLGNMKFLRATRSFPLRSVLVLTLFMACTLSADAAGGSPPILSFSRSAQAEKQSAVQQQLQVDRKVVAAGFQDSPSAEADSPDKNRRLLAPPTRAQIAAPTQGQPAPTARAPAFGLPKMESFATAAAGLAIVVGLFLVCMWMLRRSGPKPTTPLPTDAVAVLGRVPLAARNFAHLLQIGNKLVLVAITPDGVSPITEITDPVEVQRLLGLCLRNHKQSTTAEFHHVLDQLSKEPASGFLGNEVAASYAKQGRS